jgi:dihydrofolate reductase
MGSLTYAAITSLDGYVNDARGNFEWAAPDEEVHAFVNDLERETGTYLYGRRLYETMHVWETFDGESEVTRDYARIWRAADKIVYSTTLDAVSTPRTRLERSFDADAVRALKARGNVSVGGAHLAAYALRAGVVDELHQFLHPVIVGGGTSWLPHDETRIDLRLVDERRFNSGVVHLHYRVKGSP